MSHGLITREWADGSYSFRLAYGQWLDLQEAVGCGPLELYVRLLQRQWKVQQIREIIRIGLLGGGTDPSNALRLVRRYVEEQPILESVPLALEIVSASLTMPQGEQDLGEDQAVEKNSQGSASPLPTETVQ